MHTGTIEPAKANPVFDYALDVRKFFSKQAAPTEQKDSPITLVCDAWMLLEGKDTLNHALNHLLCWLWMNDVPFYIVSHTPQAAKEELMNAGFDRRVPIFKKDDIYSTLRDRAAPIIAIDDAPGVCPEGSIRFNQKEMKAFFSRNWLSPTAAIA